MYVKFQESHGNEEYYCFRVLKEKVLLHLVPINQLHTKNNRQRGVEYVILIHQYCTPRHTIAIAIGLMKYVLVLIRNVQVMHIAVQYITLMRA